MNALVLALYWHCTDIIFGTVSALVLALYWHRIGTAMGDKRRQDDVLGDERMQWCEVFQTIDAKILCS